MHVLSIQLRRRKHVHVSKLQATSNWFDPFSELIDYEMPLIMPDYKFKMAAYLPRSGRGLPGVCLELLPLNGGRYSKPLGRGWVMSIADCLLLNSIGKIGRFLTISHITYWHLTFIPCELLICATTTTVWTDLVVSQVQRSSQK